MRSPVLVMGATGTVGREVVRALCERGDAVRVLVRSPARAQGLPAGVELAQGDLADVPSLRAALRGARAAFFVTPHGPDEERLGMNVVAQAEEAGLERLVYSAAYRWSSPVGVADAALAAVTGLLGPHYRAKLAVGRRLLCSPVSHVLLRPSNFFQNDGLTRAALDGGTYLQPLGLKPINRVDVRDIALAAVRAITPGLVADGAWPLVGPRSLTGEECAALWSSALGRPIRYQPDLDRWREAVRAGLSEEAREDWAKTFRLLAKHGLATPARDLALTEQLLGRAPRSYEAWTLEHAPRAPESAPLDEALRALEATLRPHQAQPSALTPRP